MRLLGRQDATSTASRPVRRIAGELAPAGLTGAGALRVLDVPHVRQRVENAGVPQRLLSNDANAAAPGWSSARAEERTAVASPEALALDNPRNRHRAQGARSSVTV